MQGALRTVAVALLALAASVPLAAQQLGGLLSPGPLSQAHAKLEGLQGCEKCHERGRGVSAAKCLECHQPVAERMAAKRGVHRDVEGDCESCHTEHAGRNATIRPFDTGDFDHLAETGFALDGRHTDLPCEKCHTTRSYLQLRPDCASCHEDVHKGALGATCAGCHTTSAKFADSGRSFDHARSDFALVGAHATVACEKCHKNKQFRGIPHGQCADCHSDPHRGELGASCDGCHTPVAWRTERIDHARTGFPLRGRHQQVPCAECHRQPATQVKPPHAECRDCHTDPHRGSFSQDCAGCHTEQGFAGASFDHARQTEFPLLERHAEIQCIACHRQAVPAAGPGAGKVVDFRGLDTRCVACHTDPHQGRLGTDCSSCHGNRSFRLTDFRHPRLPEFFAGEHAKVRCEGCHKDGVRSDVAAAGDEVASMVSSRRYRGLPTDCASCHRDVHLGQLGPDCASCHAVDAAKFAAPGFDHARTRFALDGRHAALPCAKCHAEESGEFPAGSGTAVRFAGLGTECASCHRDPHLGQLGSACQSCHGTATFKLTEHTHREPTEFFLGEHARLKCADCHRSEEGEFPAGHGTAVRFAGLDRQCATCHADPHRGALGGECASCHDVGGPFRSASRAFHKSGLFPLEGRHLAVPCAECHLDGQIEGTPTRCYDCHWIRRQDDRYATRLGNECEDCHRPIAWTAVTWQHGGATGEPLVGAHATADCDGCHTNGIFEPGVATECVACHLGDYRGAEEPNHVQAGFPTDCEVCHRVSDTSWGQGRFDHQAVFPLQGTHRTLECESCHAGGVYQGTPRDCVGCHQADYDATAEPDHALAGFPTDCQQCHAAADSSWQQARFDHGVYPLVGSHSVQPCSACHDSGVYAGLPSDCVDCHRDDYDATTDPNHAQAGFPTDCQQCHRASDASWDQGEFDHDTTFRLEGTHATLDCTSCHAGGVFAGTPRDCVGCHQSDYDATAEPPHAVAGFSTACEDCHRAADTSWNQASFDHGVYPLVGTHAAQPCAACHDSGVYSGLPSDCVDCHRDDYDATTDPAHAEAGFPTDCRQCHRASDASWDQGEFDHDATFQLVGNHATLDCTSCHVGGVFAGTPRDCVGCHQADYDATAEPPHAVAGFSTACEDCHRAADTSWSQASFDHGVYPLVGTHASQPCSACHDSGVYSGLPSDCVDCHRDDYDATDDPDHAQAGFPTDCTLCHRASDASWDQGEFDHDATFMLQGAHTTLECDSCHGGGVFQGTPRDCVGCHQADYDATEDPNHAQAGFPTDCTQCHAPTDTAWDQADFDHGVYPLVGVHASQPCEACHASGVYSGLPSDCVDCHLDDYNGTDDPNHAQAGFPTDCTLCHDAADTNWDDGDFDHASVYQLLGPHATLDCNDCHGGGVYQGTPRECVGCHLDDFNATNDPNHTAAGFPTDCVLCHHTNHLSWDQAVFSHPDFPIASGRHSGNPCSACHPNQSNFGVFTCTTSCHPRSEMDDEHNDVSGYVYDSPACYSCHPTGQGDGPGRMMRSHVRIR